MTRLVWFSTLLSILMLLFGCAAVPSPVLEQSPVVAVHRAPGIEVNAVASRDYLTALQGAVARQDRARMLSAGFTPEQADTLLNPALSGAFLAPYLEASQGKTSATRDGEVCRVWIGAALYRRQPEKAGEACAQL